MNITKQPLYVRLLFSVGLLMVVMPTPVSRFVTIPDFLRGSMIGLGLGMEITALIIMKKNNGRDTATQCS
ncbi:MAG: hypothetical protein ACXVAY_02000 [Mucilaginibacter sp.]